MHGRSEVFGRSMSKVRDPYRRSVESAKQWASAERIIVPSDIGKEMARNKHEGGPATNCACQLEISVECFSEQNKSGKPTFLQRVTKSIGKQTIKKNSGTEGATIKTDPPSPIKREEKARGGREGCRQFRRTVFFTLLTIRVPILGLPRDGRGEGRNETLWGDKLRNRANPKLPFGHQSEEEEFGARVGVGEGRRRGDGGNIEQAGDVARHVIIRERREKLEAVLSLALSLKPFPDNGLVADSQVEEGGGEGRHYKVFLFLLSPPCVFVVVVFGSRSNRREVGQGGEGFSFWREERKDGWGGAGQGLAGICINCFLVIRRAKRRHLQSTGKVRRVSGVFVGVWVMYA
ncbi:hypothetical protein AVEN_172326-1 [Araneus ventricosus]|uniref:Uncharacterized protein n=1 Tax=Araneus ventricosus TaxID=182803 RepID=A0A4Y2E4L6_ARAVE|nr:hypothetical protein AVEN_172326-1 [Araneus ventricosus]